MAGENHSQQGIAQSDFVILIVGQNFMRRILPDKCFSKPLLFLPALLQKLVSDFFWGGGKFGKNLRDFFGPTKKAPHLQERSEETIYLSIHPSI